MTLRKTKDRYPVLTLSKNGEYKKQVKVHRLVAQAFISNPDNLPCVNHRNEDKSCNIPDNLEWCTVKYNNNYGTAIARNSAKRTGRRHSKEWIENIRKSKESVMTPVVQFTKEGEFIAEYMSQAEAARLTGCNQSHIYSCCRGERKTTHGFIWRYKE